MEPVTAGRYTIPSRAVEFFGLIHQLIPLAASAVGTRDTIQVDGSAGFIIDKQAAIYDNAHAKVRFEVGSGMMLEDVPVFLSAFGSGPYPNVLPAPLLVPRGSQFTMIADDRQTVAAANNFRILHIGRKVYDRPIFTGRYYTSVKPYRLTANFTADDGGAGTIGANAADQLTIPVPADWDFEVRKVVILADGDFTLQVRSSGRALDWFNRACHVGLLGATAIDGAITSGSWPFILPVPVFVGAMGTSGGGAMHIEVADLSGAANRVQIVFQGNRLYPAGGYRVA